MIEDINKRYQEADKAYVKRMQILQEKSVIHKMEISVEEKIERIKKIIKRAWTP